MTDDDTPDLIGAAAIARAKELVVAAGMRTALVTRRTHDDTMLHGPVSC